MAMSSAARAGDNDIVLSRLGNLVGAGEDAIGDSLAYRSMVSELAVVLAPRLLAPADTLGFGGFQFAADLGFTTINDAAPYWRVLESSPDPVGGMGVSHGSRVKPTLGMFVRKGLWLPLPSFEVGLGAVHLTGSRMWSAQGYAKFALFEGYHGWPLPSLAVRGGVSRMMGEPDLDLTILSVDASMSKAFGIAGSVALEPYAGFSALVIVPRSEVIDKTPNTLDDEELNFVFEDQDAILRNRIFGGFKIKYYVFALILEGSVALAGTSVDDRPGTEDDCAMVGAMSTNCDSTDQAELQQTYTVSLGLDF